MLCKITKKQAQISDKCARTDTKHAFLLNLSNFVHK